MSTAGDIPASAADPGVPSLPPPPEHPGGDFGDPGDGDGSGGGRRVRPRLKKLRLLLVLVPLAGLALVSTVFGMMMAVAADLPKLENRQEFKSARNTVLYDRRGEQLGVLTGEKNRILVTENQIAPAMRHAIIAIEDRRFYTNQGVDFQGIGRAFVNDVLQGKARQGGSTITQQFVKTALEAQSDRTLFQKLRESALAFHLTREWDKGKILTEYLNAIYFGNGAYGIESAARVYFGKAHPGCERSRANPCSSQLRPYEAAMLAGLVQNPTSYDPLEHPVAARNRRNLVMRKMASEGYLTQAEQLSYQDIAIPGRDDITPPEERSSAPYFTTWIKQQVVDRFGARRAFDGGLKIRTSLDLQYQRAAQEAVSAYGLGSSSTFPAAAVVAIDNKTGEVRAMVGGNDFRDRPFNLATQGQRQPGSAFKPFVLAAALKKGISPDSVWPSRKREFVVPRTRGKEVFVVNNYESNYNGSSTLARALTYSDNSVFAAVGIETGVGKVARTAERMGIRTPVSKNFAITLGGLKQGVTPLDMAHAYETFAQDGRLVTGSLGPIDGKGPTGLDAVYQSRRGKGDKLIERNRRRERQVIPASVAQTSKALMATVVSEGTGTNAQVGKWAAGKTGTTENYGDAWFVGFTRDITVAVWVGYPDKLRPMRTEYRGEPVAGGTYPADVWRTFVERVIAIEGARKAARAARRQGQKDGDSGDDQSLPEPVPQPPADSSPQYGGGDGSGGHGNGGDGGGGDGGGGTGGGDEAPKAAPEPAPAPAPGPTSPPSSGGAGGTGGAAPQ